MKTFFRNTLFFAVLAAFLGACSDKNEFAPDRNSAGIVQLMTSAADFSKVQVGSKATAEQENRITEITMIVFDSQGGVVGAPVNIKGSNPVFLIDTKQGFIIDGDNRQIDITNFQANLKSCTIYMVANCWDKISPEAESITEAKLLNLELPVSGIEIPENGFPMIGSLTGLDLSKDRTTGSSNSVENITMDKLYSKINVRFQINADQVIKLPSFTLTGWKVGNVPQVVKLGESSDEQEGPEAVLEPSKPSTDLTYGNLNIFHSTSTASPDYFQFTFYVPEHKVKADYSTADYNYPEGLPSAEQQRYKPLLCTNGQNPTYVTITGRYSDHQGLMKEVIYTLYLGQNNCDDFHILRNQQLDNIITIKGLTNHKGAQEWDEPGEEDNISVDHRVEITTTGFQIVMEREALLDSHFEVRPMDIFSYGGKFVITVDDESSTILNKDASDNIIPWLRIEASGNSANHIDGVGVRRYFTENLVTGDLADSPEITVTHNTSDDEQKTRLWLYFDENTNVYDKTISSGDAQYDQFGKKHRDITVSVKYFSDPDADTNTASYTETKYTFRQMNLWRVWSFDENNNKNRFYDIEYHEEYLHNYVSDDNYGKTTDGMPWGLGGITISSKVPAFNSGKGSALTQGIRNWILDYMKPYYDFYISADECPISNEVENQHYFPFSGYSFTNQIVSKINSEVLELTESPSSAVEYCYNKNKRIANGTVSEMKWYLPAIDEIEQIVISGYSDFSVFQNKFYWSSQPAYIYEKWQYNAIIIGNDSGDLYRENPDYARATSVKYIGGDVDDYSSYDSVDSGDYVALKNNVQHSFFGSTKEDIPGAVESRGEGYFSREKINRIRCVRKSGTVNDL